MPSIVFFHAHPDDEVLLTGGTIAKLAAAGWKVTVVTGTDGHMGEVPTSGAPRMSELRAASEVLGARHARSLGYADSGKGPVLYPDPADRQRFTRATVEEAAQRLASVLTEVRADVLIHYDPSGGYHHPDHVRVHLVGERAAALAGTTTVMEATVPREHMERIQSILGWIPQFPYTRTQVEGGGTPRRKIDTVVDVSAWVPVKMQALACHASVLGGPSRSGRLFNALMKAPARALRPVMGREWFVTTRGQAPRELTTA